MFSRPADRPQHAATRTARFLVIGATLAVIAVSVSAMTAAAPQPLKPAADTWTSSQAPSAAYGTQTVLRIDGSPAGVAYLRFNLSGVTGTVTRAVLQLYPNSSNAAGLAVHPVTSTSWSETATTWANAPAVGAARVTSAAVTAGKTVSVDVTSFVAGHGPVSLAVTDNDTTAISLASRESAHPPLLVLTIAAVATATPVVTAAPTATSAPAATTAPTAAATATATASPTTAPTAAPTSSPATGLAPTSANPVRATFYYPWFPEAWDQSGINPFTHYHPSQGFYNGASSSVVAQQIAAMQYGQISVGIASWWGQGQGTDTKFPTLLSTAAATGTGFKWAFYYEMEGTTDPSSTQIASDLAYINSHYASNPSVYKINGRPVVFVYGGPNDSCGMANRWAQGNATAHDYVILKVFPGYAACASQPDQWHQYSPAVAEDHQAGRGFAISPGFWIANGSVRLARDLNRWKQNVRDMVASKEPWQLVTTFNEWGEGTAVESATEWPSTSGYGAYLDALHNNGG